MLGQPLRGILRRHRNALATSTAVLTLESAAVLALPWLAAQAAARLWDGSAGSALLLALLGLAALQAALAWGARLLSGLTANNMLADLRLSVHAHLQALPLGFHQGRPRGELLALMTYELSQLASFVAGTVVAVLPAGLTALGAIVLMLHIDLRLGLLVAALVPVFYLLAKLAGRQLRLLSVRVQQADARTTAVAEQNLALLPVTKAFAREAERQALYTAQAQAVQQLAHEGAHVQARLEPVLQFTGTAAAIGVLWLLGDLIAQGRMPVRDWVAFVLYAALLTRPMARLAALYGQAQMARGALDHLARVMAEAPEPSGPLVLSAEQSAGEIVYEDLAFAYPGRPPVFKEFWLRVAPGQTLALTGPNGCGKTTLVHLLMRLHTPQGGRILLGGQDLAGVQLSSLRRQIALVPQNVLLFNGSVRDNIALAQPDADAARIEAAADLAQATGFIEALPHGYDTLIGDDGVRLSGGQRQKIALARALLSDAPILVLDEPTAMFDPQAEQAFVLALKAQALRRTVILITHRPATLAIADHVLALPASGN